MSKAQIEYEERLRLEQQSSGTDDETSGTPSAADTSVPWDTVGLTAFAGAAVGAGIVIVVRHVTRVPKQA